MAMPLKLGVLLSGSGTSLENLFRCIDKGELDAEVCLVVSSKPGAGGLDRARRRGIPAHVVERKALPDEAEFNRALHSVLEQYDPELLVLAGFPVRFELGRWSGRALNVHPALIPAFSGKGFYGERVYRPCSSPGSSSPALPSTSATTSTTRAP